MSMPKRSIMLSCLAGLILLSYVSAYAVWSRVHEFPGLVGETRFHFYEIPRQNPAGTANQAWQNREWRLRQFFAPLVWLDDRVLGHVHILEVYPRH